MLPDSVVSALQIGHVFFNAALFVALAFQGLVGWRIRKRRIAGALPDFSVVRRHRTLGPVLAALLPMGNLAGVSITYLSRGLWVRYPGHFAAGTVLVAVAGATFLASRRIRGAQSPWRVRHAALGLVLLCVFCVQIFLGLNVFL
jgi:uncharacterized iron-regulated membrane protein